MLERLRIDYIRQHQKRQPANEERMLTAFIYCMNVHSLFSALWESGSLKIGWEAALAYDFQYILYHSTDDLGNKKSTHCLVSVSAKQTVPELARPM